MLSLARGFRAQLQLSPSLPSSGHNRLAGTATRWNATACAQPLATGALQQPRSLLAPWNCGTGPRVAAFPAVEQFHTSAALERARQGTRLRKRKVALANKRKKELRLKKNPPPLPKKVKLMLRAMGVREDPLPKRLNEDSLEFATEDNVYEMWKYCYRRYELREALAEMRAQFHPTLLDRPDDLLYAKIECDMTGKKAGAYVDGFSKFVALMNPWDRSVREKAICAFVPTPELAKEALDAGAHTAGGLELIQDIIKGRFEVADIDNFICHDDLAIHMKALIGVLREKSPNRKNGTMGTDITKLVKTFKSGTELTVEKIKPDLFNKDEPDYGFCDTPVGLLSSPDDKIEENLEYFMASLAEGRSRGKGKGFITRVILHLHEGPKYAEYSLKHPMISDEKLRKFERSRGVNAKQEGDGPSSAQDGKNENEAHVEKVV